MRKRIAILCILPLLLCGCAVRGLLNFDSPKYQEVKVDEGTFDDKFYYEQLAESDQLIYREIYQGVYEHTEEIIVHGTDGEHAGEIVRYIMYDFPEFFWIDGSSTTVVYEGSHTVVQPTYTHAEAKCEAMQSEIDKAADEILAQVSNESDEYNKIKSIYEILINNVVYVEGAAENQNIYSALVTKESVCAGYAKANQYLLEKLGVYCIYVVGTADGESHAWNIVKCNETLYYVDATWGDPLFKGETQNEEILYDFLCCNRETIDSTHLEDTQYNYPKCEANDLDYYRLNGMFYDNANKQTLLNAMYQTIDKKEGSTTFKFSDSETYQKASDLLINGLMENAARYLCEKYNLRKVDCEYIEMTDLNRFVIYWKYK